MERLWKTCFAAGGAVAVWRRLAAGCVGVQADDRRTRCGLVRVCGWVRDGGRAVREMRAAQGALAGFLAERKNA